MMITDSLFQGLEKLNSLLLSAEEFFQSNRTVVPAWVSAGEHHLGVFKLKGKWRLLAAGPKPADELEDDDWRPIGECSVTTRLAVIDALDQLQVEIAKRNSEVEADVAAACSAISRWIESKKVARGA